MSDEITFALDIGTRTIVGILVEERKDGYQIIHSAVREHQTRAMLDGQIHNVQRVAEAVAGVKKELEEKAGLSLKKVAIAAAGRALKTVTKVNSIQLEKSRYLEAEDLETLELNTIQKAQEDLKAKNSQKNNEDILKTAKNKASNSKNIDYHFVGYTVKKYRLDGMEIGHLLGQRGQLMEVELVATFLPRIVIDSLLSVINKVGLEVEHLTLEPIAASQVVIPESMSSFNLALVDIGAGTSDIAITKEGSVSGYAMVPLAGDEITESISEKFLIDYNNAEKIKCNLLEDKKLEVKTILGESIELQRSEVISAIDSELEKLSSSIAKKILDINSAPPQAVIFIGGGSLTPGLKEKFSEKIDLIESRIGIRKREDLNNIFGKIEGVNSTQTLTPVGIAITTRETQSKAVFIEVEVNGEQISLLTLSQPTIADALLAVDIEMDKITPRPGRGITATVNGDLKIIKGEMGSRAKIKLNSEPAELKEKLSSGDQIEFKAGEPGVDAEAKIRDLIPEADIVEYNIDINGSKNKIGTKVFQNDKLVNLDQKLIDGAEIEYTVPETIKDGLSQIMEIDPNNFKSEQIIFKFNGKKEELSQSKYLVTQNNKKLDLEQKLEDELKLKLQEREVGSQSIKSFLKQKGSKEINISFNKSKLTLLSKLWQLEANGEKVSLDYLIKAGDEITAQSKPLTVAAVFEYVNYNLSEHMLKTMKILLNGEESELSSKVEDGDKLEVKLDF